MPNYYFNPYFLPCFITSFLLLFLGVFVYSRNPKSKINILLSLTCFSSFIWQFCYSMMFFSSDNEIIATFWMKIGYVGVIYISLFYYHFIVVFLEKKTKEKAVKYIGYSIATVFAILHLTTDLFTNGVIKYYYGYYPRASIVHPIFLVFFVGLTFMIVLDTFIAFLQRDAIFTDRRREQIQYLFWAFFLYSPACLDYLPNYNITYYPLGYIFAAAFLSSIVYAIVKHQLMGIEVIIRRAVVFAGLFAAIYGVIVFFMFLTQDVFQGLTGGNRWFALVPSIFIITFVLRPLENLLIRATDKYLFQKTYDYRELLRTFSNDVLSVMDLGKILNETLNSLTNILRIESCGILLLNKDKNVFELIASKGIHERALFLDGSAPLISFLERAKIHIANDKHVQALDEKGTIREDLKRLQAELVLPLILHEGVIGVLALGSKKSGEPYTQDDLDILLPLSRSEAVAISNAQALDDLSKTQAEAAQREKMAVIGTLAAGINHEICNPLGIARGQCEVFLLNARDGLYKSRPKEEQIYEAMNIMEKVIKETDRATAITKKLSTFAKPGTGDINEDVDIEHEVDEVMALVCHELRLDKIDVIKDIPKDLPHIRADKKQIQEIFFNLIRNAGQAIKEKGNITIRVKQIESKMIIDIEDTGHGIPADKLDQIFNPFYTTKAPGKGTGLGLFIVRQVVHRNKGAISVKSKVGEGTTFTLEFPVPQAVNK